MKSILLRKKGKVERKKEGRCKIEKKVGRKVKKEMLGNKGKSRSKKNIEDNEVNKREGGSKKNGGRKRIEGWINKRIIVLKWKKGKKGKIEKIGSRDIGKRKKNVENENGSRIGKIKEFIVKDERIEEIEWLGIVRIKGIEKNGKRRRMLGMEKIEGKKREKIVKKWREMKVMNEEGKLIRRRKDE